MPDYCKKKDVIDAYRSYYINEKKRFAKWTKRDIPKWFELHNMIIPFHALPISREETDFILNKE